MVLMLELVGLGVFGACLSALLCMITEDTPYKFPKVISFKEGLLRPRIIRSTNWPKWSTRNLHEDKKLKRNSHQLRSQKQYSPIRKTYGQHIQTSFPNSENSTEITARQNKNNVEKYLKKDVAILTLPGETIKCKYCENVERSSVVKIAELQNRSLMSNSVTRLKNMLRNRKTDEDSVADDKTSHGSKWRKVRTKKRRFILPKNFVIAKKTDFSEDPIDKQLQMNPRYCYLEALRIKTNKAERNA